MTGLTPIAIHDPFMLAAFSTTVGAPILATQVVVAMTITPSDLTTALIALTSLITAIGIVWVNVIAAKAASAVKAAGAVVMAKADEIDKTSKVIEGHVNSAATEAKALIDALRKENERLRETIVDDKVKTALLAQAAAVALTHQTAPTPAALVAAPAQHLQAIEENTEKTAANTARTDAAVKDLKDQA